jgi:hypothetical protein
MLDRPPADERPDERPLVAESGAHIKPLECGLASEQQQPRARG